MNGIRRNPFSAARFAPGAVPWLDADAGALAALATRACARGVRLQILGPHGSGKTTLLVELEREARKKNLRVRRARGSKLGLADLRMAGVDLLLLDEAEELGWLGFGAVRLMAKLSGAGLVVTAHRDLGLPTLARREATPELAARVVEHLLRGTDHRPPETSDLTVRLERHAGNLREVLFELYDDVEGADPTGRFRGGNAAGSTYASAPPHARQREDSRRARGRGL